ncbi:MAG TPA: hypothetical protein EYO81_04725, partial [Gammaproteobacteria bacterium]|nr:hypothetical protein [Gammaproteobacteria bacterium]
MLFRIVRTLTFLVLELKMFAVIESGGKQHKVAKGDYLQV